MHTLLRNALFTLTPLLLGSTALGQTSFYFPQIGDGIIANIRFQTTVVLVNTGPAVTVEAEFFATGSGAPLQVTLGDLGTDDSFSIDLEEGGSVSLQTPGEGGIIVGYARVTDPRQSAMPQLGGTAVFTRSQVDSGVVLYEAGVPATDSLSAFTVFVDTLNDLDTGLALVNVENFLEAAGESSAEVNLSLRDTDFQEIAETVIPLSAGAHVAQFIGQYFDPSIVTGVNEMQGTLLVDSPNAQLVAVTLRQNDIPNLDFPAEVPTLTTFPVIPGVAGSTVAGFFSVLDSDRLSVTFQMPAYRWARQVQIRFLQGDRELGTSTRIAEASRTFSDVFFLPGKSRLVNHIELEFLGVEGQRSRHSLFR